jgi:hypothetical protein
VRDSESEAFDLEFKQEPYVNKDELCKDACALANAGGGFLLIGIEDIDGKASRIRDVPETTRVMDSMRQTIRDGIQPRVLVEVIDRVLSIGGRPCNVIVCRIDAQEGPHMVARDSKTSFVSRYDCTTARMSYSDIEAAFRRKFIQQQAFLHTESTSGPIVEAVSGRTRVFEATAKALEMYGSRIIATGTSQIAIVTVAEDNSSPLGDNVGAQLLISPSYKRTGGWVAAHAQLEVVTRDGTAIQKYGDYRLTYITADADVVMQKYIDDNLCWTQEEEAFVRQPRLHPPALVEYVLSYCFLLADVYRLTRPTRTLSKTILVNIGGTVLPAGAPRTGAYESPLLPPRQPERNDFDGKPIIALYDHGEVADVSPRRLAYRLLSQIYEAYGHRNADIPYVQGEEVVLHVSDRER